MKTNPAYAHLAYRKAILTETIALLRRKYTPDHTDDVPKRLLCEEVMHCDAEVPQEEINEFLGELEAGRAEIDLEMKKFEFVRKDAKPQITQSTGRRRSRGR
jgi:hypothetical protein